MIKAVLLSSKPNLVAGGNDQIYHVNLLTLVRIISSECNMRVGVVVPNKLSIELCFFDKM